MGTHEPTLTQQGAVSSAPVLNQDTLADVLNEVRERADEIEQLRELPDDLAQRIHGAGYFRLLIPADLGGLGGSLQDWLRVATAFAEADASSGWVVGHGAMATAIFAASASPEFVREVMAHPAPMTAWSNYGKIEVREAQGGLRVNGRWKYTSGCTAASHLGGMIVYSPPETGQSTRTIVPLVPAEQARIDKVWNPVGLVGSGSHDVLFDDVTVPWRQIYDWPAGEPQADRPLATFVPGVWTFAVCCAAVHLGLARRALDEARNLVRDKPQRWSRQSVLENSAVLRALESAEARLIALRAGVETSLGAVWQSAQEGQPLDAATRMDTRLAAIAVVWDGCEIVQTAYRAAGADAIQRANVLQRLLRDANCLTQHVSVNEAALETIGRVRCGMEPLSWKV